MGKFLNNQAAQAFETFLGFFVAYSGVAGLFDYGLANNLFQHALGWPLSAVFNAAYALSGLALFFGIGFRRKDIEGAGLIVIAASLIIRCVVVYNLTGLDPELVTGYIGASGFVVACGARFWLLFDGYDVVKVKTLEGVLKPGAK